MFDYKMVSRAVLYVHLILCGYFVVFSTKLHLKDDLIIFALGSGVIGLFLIMLNNKKIQFATKFIVPVLLLTLVTLYGFESKKLGMITILILAISCISSLYADFIVTGLIMVYSIGLYKYTLVVDSSFYAETIEESEIFINIFSLFIGQLMIIILLIFCKRSLTNSKNKTRQVQELLGHADIETTQIYTHLSKKSEMEAYEKARKRK